MAQPRECGGCSWSCSCPPLWVGTVGRSGESPRQNSAAGQFLARWRGRVVHAEPAVHHVLVADPPELLECAEAAVHRSSAVAGLRTAMVLASAARSPAAGDRAARVSRAEARGGRASGRGRAVRSHGRCALSRQLALRPGGSAHRCSTESPSSRGAADRRRSGRARAPSQIAALGNV